MNKTGHSSSSNSNAEFFDQIGDDYDQAIIRCVPRYAEMLDQMIDYVATCFRPPINHKTTILELGCGSGNLTQRLLGKFKPNELLAVDASSKMIEIAQNRTQHNQAIQWMNQQFQDLKIAEQSIDLVASSISFHHLQDPEKLTLFQNIRNWLRPTGVFTFCDQFRGATDQLYEKHMDNWKEASMQLGATESEWRDWMDHQTDHDYHSSHQTHVELLTEAGFQMVDCTRRHLLWTTLVAT